MKRKNTGIHINEELHRQCAEFAKPRKWRNFSAFVEEAISEKLDREKKKEAKA